MAKKWGQVVPYVLGLDVGASSVGWAALEVSEGDDCEPIGLMRLGSRIFPAGVEGSDKQIEMGLDESRGMARRLARQVRRQLSRRAQRLRKLLRLLQRLELLPQDASETPELGRQLFERLDAKLMKKWAPTRDHRRHQLLPYSLRASAVEEPLERHELGRALYHLAQRRGYLSNRLTPEKPGDDAGEVKEGISELAEQLRGRTLGQFFRDEFDINPNVMRIRSRYTSREMYLNEFERIWERQIQTHLDLKREYPQPSDEKNRGKFRRGTKENPFPSVHDEVKNAIFFQRKLKSAKRLVGRCSLETEMPRCPKWHLVHQEFRILQAVNHLLVEMQDGEIVELEAEQRRKLIDELQTMGEVSFAAAKKLLGLKKAKFNLEEKPKEASDETTKKGFIGNRTAAKITLDLPGVGAWWSSLSEDRRHAFVHEFSHYQKSEALARRLVKFWGIDGEEAAELSVRQPESGYANHSLLAMEQMMPYLRNGLSYTEAKEKAYPDSMKPTEVFDTLPPFVHQACRHLQSKLRNPAVARALSEVRKVVNAVVAEYGRPDRIVVELGRDLKRSREDRESMSKDMREQERRRLDAKRRILEKKGWDNPSRQDVEKVLLWDECHGICPYTGKCIGFEGLFGKQPQFDVEHIYPRRYLDDSFANKTLCHVDFNRHTKGNRLPAEMPVSRADFETILERVRTFQGKFANAKLERFQHKREDIPPDFVDRQLNDTRQTGKLARAYLALLYGGKWDEGGTLRVLASSGRVTAHLRRVCGASGVYDELLKDVHGFTPQPGNTEKHRLDHRHHAVDAVVIALTRPKIVKELSDAASKADAAYQHRFFSEMPPPWDGFHEHLKTALRQCLVSHRADRRLGGKLHAESNYSREIATPEGKVRRIRKPLFRLTKKEIEKIADDRVKKLVEEKLAEIGGTADKVFADANNLPRLPNKNDPSRPIIVRKTRITVDENPRTIAKGGRERNVSSAPGTNHHAVIVAKLDANGNEVKWEMKVVTRLEAYRRKRSKQPVVQKDFGPGWRFMFSLIQDDCLEVDRPNGTREIYRVANLSDGDMQLWEHWRANPDMTKRKTEGLRGGIEKFRKLNARKVVVSPLGDVWVAGE